MAPDKDKTYSMLRDGDEPAETERKRTPWSEYLDESTRKALENAPTRRSLAWKLLKQGAPPAYVALRYGYSVAQMEQAAAELERRRNEASQSTGD